MSAVAGRLKSDYRYTKDIVYNNSPWCDPKVEQKAKIEKTAQNILDVRAKYSDSDQIAEKYSEDAMRYDYNTGKYTPQNEDTLDLLDILIRIEAAEKMYAEFRGLTDDAATAANNTGWSVDDVATVKNHLFNDIVFKDNGYSLLDPDYEIAVACEWLIEGNYYESNILLLEHHN